MRNRDGSFTAQVLSELAPHTPQLPHCRRAMLCGMGAESIDGVLTNRLVSARAALSCYHATGEEAHVQTVRHPRRTLYRVAAPKTRASDLSRPCCRRSLLRGAFMVSGSLARLDAGPHLEITLSDDVLAGKVLAACGASDISVQSAKRRGRTVILMRSARDVGMFLSTIGAHHGRLQFEDARVTREVRANVNRTLNAETANLRRTAEAGVRQAEHAVRLRDSMIWTALPYALREAAELRIAAPGDTLARLAARAGCSRSAFAGRLRRLMEVSPQGGGGNVPATVEG